MTFYVGVVEDRNDPYKSGRCRVRVFGLHTEDTAELPVPDLPWAVPLLPATQAGTSGIGASPTGLVEGSWVVIVYADEFKQQPIIIGQIGSSIPQKKDPAVPKDQAPATGGDDGSTTTTTTNPDGQTTTTTNPGSTGKALSPSQLHLSPGGAIEMKKHEALSSLRECGKDNSKKVTKYGTSGMAVADDAPIFPYYDTVADPPVWTIGWGSTYLQNGRVTESTRLNKKQCDELFYFMAESSDKSFANEIRKALKVPVTQQMFDALVSIAYNTGAKGLIKHKAFSALNSGDYAACQAQIPTLRAADGPASLRARRAKERALFDSEGYPQKTTNTPEKTPQQSLDSQLPTTRQTQSANSVAPTTTSPTTTSPTTTSPTTTSPLDRFINPTAVTEVSTAGMGFRDPNGKYPSYKNESDTNRLAGHQNLDNTIVERKDAMRTKGISGPDGKTWSQPRAAYKAMYPYNHVRQSESGHVEEFDDTPGAERTLRYHRSGTFSEVDVNGTQVNKIIGDAYEIMDRNGYIQISGNCNVTIGGNANIRVANDAVIQVVGNLTTNVNGNHVLNVAGNSTTNITGNHITNVYGNSVSATNGNSTTQVRGNDTTSVNGNVLLSAVGNYGLQSSGKVQTKSGGNIEMQSGGNTNIDGAQIHLNSGNSVGLSAPTSIAAPAVPAAVEAATGAPEFQELQAPDRRQDMNSMYETPEEGAPSSEYKKATDKHFDDDEKNAPDGTKKEETAPSASTPTTNIPPSGDCLITDADLSPGMKIQRLFTLNDLVSAGESGMPKGMNFGLSPKEIVCNMRNLALQCLDPIKARYPNMSFNSVWRSQAVNNKYGGKAASDHLTGSAADLHFSGFSRKQYYEAIIEIQKMLPSYRQLILEYKARETWIHVAYVSPGNKAGKTNSKQNMTINALANKTISNNQFVLWD